MKNKKLKILFLYPNLNMSTLVPNAISIFTAVLKAELMSTYKRDYLRDVVARD